MTPTLAPAPPPAAPGPYRLTAAQYQRMTEAGVFGPDERVELIRGQVVAKMPRNPPHDSHLLECFLVLQGLLPPGWVPRPQMALPLGDSQVEPDIAVVRRDPGKYRTRHPGPADTGLVVEVADTTLYSDRRDKGALYAAAGIPEFWLVNVAARRVEVYSGPTAAGYATRRDVAPGGDLPLTLDGAVAGRVPVADLFA